MAFVNGYCRYSHRKYILRKESLLKNQLKVKPKTAVIDFYIAKYIGEIFIVEAKATMFSSVCIKELFKATVN